MRTRERELAERTKRLDLLDLERTRLPEGHAEGRAKLNVRGGNRVGVDIDGDLTSAVRELDDGEGALWWWMEYVDSRGDRERWKEWKMDEVRTERIEKAEERENDVRAPLQRREPA
jgi:hypothetical protein